MLSRWSEETLQRHPQSLSGGFRNTYGVLGTDCTGAIKVARSHQQRSSSLRKKMRICEAVRKRRERKAKTNEPPADSMTLTCSTSNRQFKASQPSKNSPIHLNLIQEIMMVLLIIERRTSWLPMGIASRCPSLLFFVVFLGSKQSLLGSGSAQGFG